MSIKIPSWAQDRKTSDNPRWLNRKCKFDIELLNRPVAEGYGYDLKTHSLRRIEKIPNGRR